MKSNRNILYIIKMESKGKHLIGNYGIKNKSPRCWNSTKVKLLVNVMKDWSRETGLFA